MPEQQGRVTHYYSEEESAEYSRLEIPVIRHLAESGVISGVQVVGEDQPRYTSADIVLLRRARRLYQDLNVNLEGIEIILRLCARVEMLQSELARYEGMAERTAGDRLRGNTGRDTSLAR